MTQRAHLLDQDGHLTDHRAWDAATAQALADTLALNLTDTHMRVLLAVRNFYKRYEHAPNTRPLIKHLTKELPDLPISNAYLQEQFNTGLVARHLSRLAGLPKPSNCL